MTPSIMSVNNLPGNQGPPIINALKRDGTAVFTLRPDSPDLSGMAGPFTGGAYFRVEGMHVFLVGARSKNTSQPSISLRVSTSGVYQDVDEPPTKKVFNFTIMPWSASFRYHSPTGSDQGATIEVDSWIPSPYYVNPTPFTQWMLGVNTDNFDLSGLTDVRIQWTGLARFHARRSGHGLISHNPEPETE
jgi:hypothetical protein